MCEKRTCSHHGEELCTCRPVKERDADIISLISHVFTNMTDVMWELDYTDINRPEKRRLCLVGVCRVCGGRLCHEVDASDNLTGDDFLAAVYRHLCQVHNAGGRHMARQEFRERFARMFREQERPMIYEWLERLEKDTEEDV